jgi:hypothetical protein
MSIAELNDQLRSSATSSIAWTTTESISELPADLYARAWQNVRAYADFAAADRAHDHGRFELEGHKFAWAITHFDPPNVVELEGGEIVAVPAIIEFLFESEL